MKRVYTNSLFNLLKVLSTLIFPLISYSYATHILEAENIGKVEFSRSIASYFVLLAMLGIVSYATREAALLKYDKEKLSRFTHEILIINLLAVIISLILFFCLIFFFSNLYDYKLLLLINAITVLLVPLGLEWLFAAMEDYAYISIRTIVIQMVSTVLILILVKSKEDLYLYAFLHILSTVAPNIINIIYSKKYIKWQYLGNYGISRHFSSVLLMFLVSISVQIFSNLDTTMLGIMSGDKFVGYYVAATKMVNIVSSLLVAVITVLTPKITVLVKKQDWEKIRAVSYRAIDILFMLSIPAAVGLFVLSKSLILIFSGESFLLGNTAAKILSARVILSPLNTFFIVQLFVSMKREKNNLFTTSIAAIVNIIFNFALIPQFVQNGAAISTVLAELIELLFNFYFVRHLLEHSRIVYSFTKYLITSLSILILAVILRITGSNDLTRIFIFITSSASVYFIILYFLNDSSVLMISNNIMRILKRKDT
ncbi:flippase [Streptococcus sp. E29BA]|uniref:flippase n=1 Tax=Streptococcus sp. E29BA TaxID=3278716 RepID=UPI00359DD260